jgi:hypothetical protein
LNRQDESNKTRTNSWPFRWFIESLKLKRTWIAGIAILASTSIGLTYISFLTGDSATERSMRSLISSTFRTLANLDSDDFNKPVAVEQTFLLNGRMVAFTDKLVYQPDSMLVFSYSAPETMSAVISRKDVGLPSPSIALDLNEVVYARPLTVNSLKGFDPKDFARVEIDLAQFNSGWHQIVVRSSEETKHIPFFVEPSELKSRIVFVESTNTLKSYVSDGELRTHYVNPGNLLGKFTRPDAYPVNYEIKDFLGQDSGSLSCHDHLINADLVLKKRLMEIGVAFDVVSDEWLTESNLSRELDLVILGAHNEYWESRKFRAMESFLEGGGSLLLLGGNTAWRFQEHVDNSYTLVWGNGALRTEHSEFIRDYLGTHFDSRDYGTSSDFTLSRNLPDFLTGSKLESSFGAGTDFQSCAGEVNGASGHETDKLVDPNAGFEVIARGNNFLGGADVVHKTFGDRGRVLNFGSVGLWHRLSDPTIQEIIKNFIGKVSQ